LGLDRSVSNAGKVVAVTGGAAGIGLAFARRWIAEGGKTVLLDRSNQSLETAVSTLGTAARGVACDVTAPHEVDDAMRSIARHEGHLNGLVNGAGIIIPGPSGEITDEDFARVLDIHVTGAMRVCRAAYPLLLQSRGAIVNISSIAATMGLPGRASYTAAKAGIEGLMRTLAVEWAAEGIRVNAVAPGYTRTEMTGSLIRQGKLDAGRIEARTPLRRFAEPDEIAAAIAFLLSDDASYITGHALVVDGGRTVDGNWY
jgi:NAD(P)-dependent dehydrogenase (short-subunit alcohol dehydrogenase family)